MPISDWVQIFVYVGCIIVLTPLLGVYIANVLTGQKTWLSPILGPIERSLYRKSGIDPSQEMNWKSYGKALLYFNLFGFLAVFLIVSFQRYLPFNPEQLPGLPFHLSFNIASSFATNTNWQSYAGETTLSYFSQMAALTVQNFLSAGTGISASLVLIRGIQRNATENLGNFYADLVRSVIYILLPLSLVWAFVLMSEGVVQTLSSYVEATTLEKKEPQMIPLGPVASQAAIKQLGSNGGGFFNVNSAHPFENPTALTNFFAMVAILLIPSALVYAYGLMIGSRKHGWILFLTMLAIWTGVLVIVLYSEYLPNKVLGAYPVLEGKETRIGIVNSAIWAVSTTATSNGSVNAMLSSLSPLAGGVCLFNIMLGETIFGGVGVGLASIIMFAMRTVFLCGLMVGRSPEYLGKKLEKKEVQWLTVSLLVPSCLLLIGSGFSCILPSALASLGNRGPHGLSEILYAFTSSTGNNGSAFAGLNANTPYYNILLGLFMIISRVAIILPSVRIGGLLSVKKHIPASSGTFSTESFWFVVLLIAIIIIVGGLSFFPVLALGPIAEHFLMMNGRSF